MDEDEDEDERDNFMGGWTRTRVIREGVRETRGVWAAVGSGRIRRCLSHDPRELILDQSEQSIPFDDVKTI